jgi:chromosome partitioning protein
MKIVAVYSNKGGVGKTTTAVNLAYLSSLNGLKTLFCDLDPQSSASYYFRVKPKIKSGVNGFLEGDSLEDSIKATDYENLDILPSDITLRKIDVKISKTKTPKKHLGKILSNFKNQYDIIFIDSPPTFNLLAENIFNCADFILIPIIPTTLSIRTYDQLNNFFRSNKYKLKKIVTFFSMVDKRKKMHLEFIEKVNFYLPYNLKTLILQLSDIEKMGITREPVLYTSPNSKASMVYKALWSEFKNNYLKI